jgi:phosphatidylglycerophosphate synthase
MLEFGPANQVTAVRALLVALLAMGVVGPVTLAPAVSAIVATVAVLLDGLDGWIARRTRSATTFGARFDMEVDALLILVLSATLWEEGKVGAWALAAGLMRYAFLAAGWLAPWLRQPLPESFRRKAVCVVQMVALIAALLPGVGGLAARWIVALSLLALAWSFLIDVFWLASRRAGDVAPLGAHAAPRRRASQMDAAGWLTLAAALAFLNISLSFQNVWPTPAISWRGELSIELAVVLLGLAAYSRRRGAMPPRRWLAGIWVILAISHYADVTAPALYGRDVNLYWDLRHVSNVAEMLVAAASTWAVGAAAVAALVVVGALYAGFGVALDRVVAAYAVSSARVGLVTVAVLAVALFAVERVGADHDRRVFSRPVTQSYLRQLRLLANAVGAPGDIEAGPTLESDLGRVKGADVFIVFIESYGAVTFDRPEFAEALAASRRALDEAVHDTGRVVVSAYADAPTFGGSSWLSHLSLLSGIEVRDPDRYAAVMTQNRDTLATTFAKHGYRTIAVMPGLWQNWPEGAFYRFDQIYNGWALDYRGPEFGWWALPDQFTLARIDDLEVDRPSRAPLFVVYPTVNTHAPFSPTPPYQPDWSRILSPTPYESSDLTRAFEREPDWLNLGPSYANALAYTFTTLAGYIRRHDGRDLVLIVLGDHQPPAAVAGEGAPWHVPVHVIVTTGGARGWIAERLRASGFVGGLTPRRPAVSRMHALAPLLLSAFSATS